MAQASSPTAAAAFADLEGQARHCRRCDLFRNATQLVFGEGTVPARLMLIGEQPGDQEDLAGRPFVGPAGRLLDKALDAVGIDRDRIYLTNAVKHFKYRLRGKRRLHERPNAGEVIACRWWYNRERRLVRPLVTLAMGATAARAMLGRSVAISAARTQTHSLEDGTEGRVTVHPSYLLRIRNRDPDHEEYRKFLDDLAYVRDRMAAIGR